jgi:pyruvate formate lyase activating enzyme
LICPVCPHHCTLSESGTPGRCRARRNVNSLSTPIGYGKITSIALDPIEKKPLAYFHPGHSVLSVGGAGCNMDCYFCQNDSISCAGPLDIPMRGMPPQELAHLAQTLTPRGNIGVAFTYNEPLICYEYVIDTARLLKAQNQKTVVVTNGNFCPEAMPELFALVDAFNIDLKGFTAAWYRRLGGDLSCVQRFIQAAAASAHVELTTLVVPNENDSSQEMDELARWVASIDQDIPLHINRFFPRRHARGAPTPISMLHTLAGIARQHLTRVQVGNV